jgi:basic membrane lipoprotein Med (substrate-binding protein (PBP1-ABC) superfamily)
MRKRFWLGLALMLITGLLFVAVLGCGGGEEDPGNGDPEEKVRVGVIYSIPDPARAGGWDRAQFAGHSILESEFGWEVSIAESVDFPKLAETAAEFAENGFDLVIFTSSAHTDAWMEVAPQYPDTWFLMMSMANELPDAEKVAAWSPDMYVYGTMVGSVAAMASESGIIGAIGGMPIPALTVMYSGIIEGAKAINPDSEVLVSWVGDWVDVATHSEVTRLQTDQGADMIFVVTGPATKGVFEGAEAGGALVIGYASDWYNDAPDAVLTSVLVDTLPIYREMAEAYLAGTLTRKINELTAANFSLADFRGKLAEKEAEIRDTVAKIQSGEIEIPRVMHELE